MQIPKIEEVPIKGCRHELVPGVTLVVDEQLTEPPEVIVLVTDGRSEPFERRHLYEEVTDTDGTFIGYEYVLK